MSNTSTVSPYDDEIDETFDRAENTSAPELPSVDVGAAAVALGVASAAAAVGLCQAVQWVLAKTPEDREHLKNLRDHDRAQLLGGPVAELVSASTHAFHAANLSLPTAQAESLVKAAQSLGYRREELPVAASALSGGQQAYFLVDRAGRSLAIAPNARGRLTLFSSADRVATDAVVRRHSLERTLDFFAAQGLAVRHAELPSGEVRVFAEGRRTPGAPRPPAVRTDVEADGRIQVDVAACVGPRCAEIVEGLANAVGGTVTHTDIKPEYFQVPAAPIVSKVKV